MTSGNATSLVEVDALARGLASVLGSTDPITVLERTPNEYGSTFPTEIVTCAVGGDEVRVLCKYELSWAKDVYGYPAGVVYEEEVYRCAVEPSGLSAPRCYGLATDPETDATWLVVEHLSETLRLANAPDPLAISRAARWIGLFHRLHERASVRAAERLNRFDRRHFSDCVERVLTSSSPLATEYPWLASAAERFLAEQLDLLLDRPTLIHGEFYPDNVLVRGGRIHPVDWASAGWSAGEIDLAALTEGDWSAEAVEAAAVEYARARWGSDPPAGFAQHLESARTYLHFRALGDEPSSPFEPSAGRRFEQLRLASQNRGARG